MFELIARLRLRPLAYRRRVAMLGAGGITALIVLMWLVSFTATNGNTSATQATAQASEPLSVIIEQFQKLFKSLK